MNFLPHKVRGTLFNFICRSGGIFAKFLLIVYISRAMTISALGLFNIISVTVAWSVYVVGFEFYSYSLRKIVGENTEVVSNHVYNQFVFHLVGYVLLLFVCPFLIALDFIPLQLLPYFLLITIFDQLSQECFRICVALERSQFANFLYFLKSGLWVYPLLVLPFIGVDIDIHLILAAWLIGTVTALAVGVIKLVNLKVINFRSAQLDVPWVKEGVVVAFPFLIISVAQLTMDFSDRYLIDYFLGKESVGIYSFFYGIANVPTTLITSVLLIQYYPKIINIYKFPTPKKERDKVIRDFLFQSIGFAIIVSLPVYFGVGFLLDFIGKSELSNSLSLLYIMLAQVIIFGFQVVIQTILYARLQDKFLLYTALAGAGLNILINIFLIPMLGINGAAISTLLSMTLMLLLRLYLLYKLKRNLNHGTF